MHSNTNTITSRQTHLEPDEKEDEDGEPIFMMVNDGFDALANDPMDDMGDGTKEATGELAAKGLAGIGAKADPPMPGPEAPKGKAGGKNRYPAKGLTPPTDGGTRPKGEMPAGAGKPPDRFNPNPENGIPIPNPGPNPGANPDAKGAAKGLGTYGRKGAIHGPRPNMP